MRFWKRLSDYVVKGFANMQRVIQVMLTCLIAVGCQPSPKSDVTQISFAELSLEVENPDRNLQPEAAEHLPARIKELSGKRVRISGFPMIPVAKSENTAGLFLRSEPQITNFGAPTYVDEVIVIHLRNVANVDLTRVQEITVEGNFHLAPQSSDGRLDLLYSIDDANILLE